MKKFCFFVLLADENNGLALGEQSEKILEMVDLIEALGRGKALIYSSSDLESLDNLARLNQELKAPCIPLIELNEDYWKELSVENGMVASARFNLFNYWEKVCQENAGEVNLLIVQASRSTLQKLGICNQKDGNWRHWQFSSQKDFFKLLHDGMSNSTVYDNCAVSA